MTHTDALPARINFRVLFRWLFSAVALAVVAAIVVPPIPAHALENQAYGDVIVPAGSVTDEVSTGMGDVRVEGVVEGNVSSGTGSVLIEGAVDGDIKAGRGNVTINAPVEGDVNAGLGDVRIDAPVNGDVDVGHGDVYLGSGARVDGDLRCASGKIERERGAIVNGNTLSGMTSDFRGDPGPSRLLGLVGWMFAALALVGGTVLAAVLMPGPLGSVVRQIEAAPVLSLGLGIVSAPVAVVLTIMLAVSVIGSPLILLLLPAYFGLALFGTVVVSFFVGRRFLFATSRHRGGNALAAIVGALLVAAVYAIPFVGHLLFFLLTLLGLGATILALFARRRPRSRPSYETYVRDRGEVQG